MGENSGTLSHDSAKNGRQCHTSNADLTCRGAARAAGGGAGGRMSPAREEWSTLQRGRRGPHGRAGTQVRRRPTASTLPHVESPGTLYNTPRTTWRGFEYVRSYCPVDSVDVIRRG